MLATRYASIAAALARRSKDLGFRSTGADD